MIFNSSFFNRCNGFPFPQNKKQTLKHGFLFCSRNKEISVQVQTLDVLFGKPGFFHGLCQPIFRLQLTSPQTPTQVAPPHPDVQNIRVQTLGSNTLGQKSKSTALRLYFSERFFNLFVCQFSHLKSGHDNSICIRR